MAEGKKGDSGGPATDSGGWPVQDPTSNVRALLSAAVQRQDDLREKESAHVREIVDLHADLDTLRATYDEKLRTSESARIDSIRAVDVAAVQRAAEVAATQASTLATVVATSAETLRVQVATEATRARSETAAALEPMQKDIAELRRSQYELAGQRTAVVETKTDSRAGFAIAFGVLGSLVGVISLVIVMVRG